MTRPALSDTLQRFLTGDIGSVECLDVLLFLYRHATRWWGAQTLAAELEMPAGALQLHLEHLSAHNLLDVRITESVIYCYRPARSDLSQLVDDIARAHYLQRDAVMTVLTGRASESARLFAEAFQIRKGKRDG